MKEGEKVIVLSGEYPQHIFTLKYKLDKSGVWLCSSNQNKYEYGFYEDNLKIVDA